MHIIYVTPEFVTETAGGGLATYLSNISRIMAGHGHRITVVTLSSDHDDKMIWEDGIIVERVKKDSRIAIVPLQILKQSFDLHRRVKRITSAQKADIVQYASYRAVGFFHVQRTPSLVRISSDPVCWRTMRLYDFSPDDLRKTSLSDKIEYAAERRIGNVLGPGVATGARIAERIHIKPVIVESPFYPPVEEDETLFNERLKGKKYFLAHSSMSCFKGTHTIAESIPMICEADPDIYFVFAGTDLGIDYKSGQHFSAKEYIERCAGKYVDRVIILGAVQRKQLVSIIRNAYGCLMPSRLDNMPNTCIEAMSLGRIVIGTTGAGFEQLIQDGVNGFLMDIDSPASLAKAAARMEAMSETERDAVRTAAMKTTERFNPENVYTNMYSYYTSVIESFKK